MKLIFFFLWISSILSAVKNLFIQVFRAELARDQGKWDEGSQVYTDSGQEKKENTYKSFTGNTDV